MALRPLVSLALLAVTGCPVGRSAPDAAGPPDAPIADVGAPELDAPSGTDAPESCARTRRVDTGTCSRREILFAPAGEEGMWGAVRLLPPAGSSLVRVGYPLAPPLPPDPAMPIPCTTALGHRVRIFTGGRAAPPPADPAILAELSVPAAPPSSTPREIALDLPSPIVVPAGQDVWVAIEMVRAADGVLCGLGCSTPGTDTYWSNAVAAPYAWEPLAASAIEMELGAWVCGN